MKYRVGRSQQRVILTEDGQKEVAQFQLAFKYLAQPVCDFLNTIADPNTFTTMPHYPPFEKFSLEQKADTITDVNTSPTAEHPSTPGIKSAREFYEDRWVTASFGERTKTLIVEMMEAYHAQFQKESGVWTDEDMRNAYLNGWDEKWGGPDKWLSEYKTK